MTAGEDRLAPGARPFMEALAGIFPDVGGTVTDVAEARRILAAAPRQPFPPRQVREVTELAVTGPPGAPELPVRVYRPYADGPRPTVVFLHGGGWVLCGLDTHDRRVRTLCAGAGAVVVSADYRLAPEVRFPAPVEDAYAAVCWAADRLAAPAAGRDGDVLGGDPEALVVAGDSAGCSLAAAASLMARDRAAPVSHCGRSPAPRPIPAATRSRTG